MTGTNAGAGRLRWLFVIPGLGGGGAERVLVEVTGELARVGDEVTVLTYEDASRDRYRLGPHIRRVEAGLPPLVPGAGANLRRLRLLRSVIDTESPDLIVSFLTHTNVLAVVAARSRGIPVIISERTDPRRHSEKRRWRVLRALTYPFADALVVPGSAVAAIARAQRWNRDVVVLPNPVSAEGDREPAGLPELPAHFVLGVGRLGPEKGFDLLLQAFSRVPDPTLHLVIAGEGPDRGDLLALARALAIDERVHLPGWVADSRALMRRATAFVLSSRYEGFPNVLLEALSVGCPAVAFDCQSGPGEIISHGANGLLVRAESIDELAGSIARLCGDPGLRQRLGQAALLSIGRHGLPAVCEQWRALASRITGREAGDA